MTPARRVFLQFISAVAALHAGAIALYYMLEIPAATPERQQVFAWTWIGLTAVLVFAGLHRIKRVRKRGSFKP